MPDENEYERGLQEAKEKFEKYKQIDPFSNIASALLNSADISDYVRLTGMIYPFREEDLRPATYGIRLKGKIVRWAYDISQKSYKKDVVILKGKNDEFIVKRNTISFLTLEPYLQIPTYMVARFNLKIDHVYRGLLLGTGPIIDPGYTGYLSIPLHNLTNNDYVLQFDDMMIWMEFTKLSRNKIYGSEKNIRLGEPAEYKPKKKERDVEDFLNEAYLRKEIVSSLESVLREIDETQRHTQKQQEKFDRFNLFSYFSISGIVAIFLTFGIYFSSNYSSMRNEVKEILRNQADNKELYNLKKNDSILNARIDSLKTIINANRDSRSSGNR